MFLASLLPRQCHVLDADLTETHQEGSGEDRKGLVVPELERLFTWEILELEDIMEDTMEDIVEMVVVEEEEDGEVEGMEEAEEVGAEVVDVDQF
jgi:hypothetical protein